MSQTNAQRLPAEALFQTELDALIAAETDPGSHRLADVAALGAHLYHRRYQH